MSFSFFVKCCWLSIWVRQGAFGGDDEKRDEKQGSYSLALALASASSSSRNGILATDTEKSLTLHLGLTVRDT